MDAVHYSSKKHDWETPPDLFDKLNSEFGFDLDVCATRENTKCRRFLSPNDDALSSAVDWTGRCWMNPPYGRGLDRWIEKAWRQRANGNAEVMVALVPARTDTKYWHEYIMRSYEIRFLPGRLKFVGAENCAPFPSAVIIF